MAQKPKPWSRSSLGKRAHRGFRGYPVATIAIYGPNAEFASKVAVGIISSEDSEADPLERWYSDEIDIRRKVTVGENIVAFVRRHGARSVVMSDRIMGCPHEEGIDYPVGQVCPQCPFWADRDRFTGETVES